MSVTGEPAKGEYLIDPGRSVISFSTRAVYGLLRVRGTFRVGHGKISVAEPTTASTVDAVVDAASFDSANAERDEHVRAADFLDVENHPEIVFRGEGVDQAANGKRTLRGTLTVRGVTQPISLALRQVAGDDQELVARATTRIDRYAFGVTHAKGMTARYLTLTLDIVANR
ncbi:YceI family protein [Lentzea sp. HUAS TT2]|uniref:YceI family protein n=1 Tax=Lentzea sp. HUAS TT2 TaxID=3447454 RepID=UPI003F6FCB71